jgi:hypothetical protein
VYALSASTCRYLPGAGNARINPAVKQEAKRATAVLVAASERYEQGEKEREGGAAVPWFYRRSTKLPAVWLLFCVREDLRNEQQLIV